MRLVKLLFPVAAVVALLGFALMRLFDASAGDAPPLDRDPRVEVAIPRPDPLPPTTGAAGSQVAATPAPPPSTAPVDPREAPVARTRLEIEQRLRGSGPAVEPWAAEMGESMRQVLAGPQVQAAIRNAPTVECFAEGCIARLVFASAGELDLRQQEIGEARSLERWSRVITGPEPQPDGSVENALVVFRPPSPEELAELEERRALLSTSR